MRYTPLATDALCPMPYALCPREHLVLLRKAIVAKKSEPVTGDLRTDGPSAIAQSSLMLLSLKKTSKFNGDPSPQPLPLQALRPEWLP